MMNRRMVFCAGLAMATLGLVACQQVAPAATARQLPAAPPQVVRADLVPPPLAPPPLKRDVPAIVRVDLETEEHTARLADGVEYTFWTFGGTVPGPMVRVRQGDTVEIRLKNAPSSTMPHSIDSHAVTGPGGGAVLTQTAPGAETGFRFRALNPGLYVYHCATPSVPEHIANGMYGMILVEPEGGLPPVDKEYYVMQGEFYTHGALGEPGKQAFSAAKMLAETPEYIVFNGSTTALAGDKSLHARVGDAVRVYFGAGGPNITSSFHVIGEIFDRVYPEGGMEPVTNVQTTLVPAGGGTMVEMRFEVPGTYIIVDHSLSRLLRGAAGYITVEGEPEPGVFGPLTAGGAAAGSPSH